MSSSSPAPEPPSGPDAPSRFAALKLSPRAAVVLAAGVVVVAVSVVLFGVVSGRSAGSVDGQLSVTGAPSAGGPGVGGAPAGTVAGAVGGASGADGGGGSTGGPGPSGEPSATSPASVVVHVVGAVARPGIVTLPSGSRVSDAVRRAGDAGSDADLTRLNLARIVVDGERLYVPRIGEVDIPQALDGAGSAAGAGGDAAGGVGDAAGGGDGAAPVDLNTADQATLETLPGIGPSLAGRILAWRDEHGRFTVVEDLLDVSGIGDGRFADLRDRVRV